MGLHTVQSNRRVPFKGNALRPRKVDVLRHLKRAYQSNQIRIEYSDGRRGVSNIFAAFLLQTAYGSKRVGKSKHFADHQSSALGKWLFARGS